MEFEQIVTLIQTISDSKVSSFLYEKDNVKISIKTGDSGKKSEICVVPPVAVPQMPPVPMATQMPLGASVPMGTVQTAVPAELSQAVQTTESAEKVDAGEYQIVTSPLVGTFYSAASPEDEPFVKVGDRVQKGQKLGIIEAMKLMNDIESDYDGEIVEILVSNENMVEYGQPLFKIK